MLSNSQVDRAGAALRDWWSSRGGELGPAERQAVDLIWEFRQLFAYPMTKVSSNLRYYVRRSNAGDVAVTQRHKRLPRIVQKLNRQPRMRLSQMQDVGGCRAVLHSQEVAYDVLEGIQRNWDIIRVDDYVKQPRPTGYRALHAIVRRDGRAVEVQLRTEGQQTWADEVERLDGRTPHLLKDGEGPADALEYTRKLADLIAGIDSGATPEPGEVTALQELRSAASRSLGRFGGTF